MVTLRGKNTSYVGVAMWMVHDDVVQVLRQMGVPPSILKEFPSIPAEVDGMLVYGSQARGDAVASSDLDLLALTPVPRPSTYAGDVNVSFYTERQLLTGVGTLFGAHLKRDGKILFDRDGHLAGIIGAMGHVDTDRLLLRAWRMCELFSNPESDLPKYLLGLLREARYLLRSCLYAKAIADGNACFSVRELAVRLEDPHLVKLLASRPTTPASAGQLEECLSRLRDILGEFPPSRHGSLEATVVNEWGSPSDILSMAFMALGVAGDETDYAEVEKILL